MREFRPEASYEDLKQIAGFRANKDFIEEINYAGEMNDVVLNTNAKPHGRGIMTVIYKEHDDASN